MSNKRKSESPVKIFFEILSDSKAKYIRTLDGKKINRDFLYFTASNIEKIEKQILITPNSG